MLKNIKVLQILDVNVILYDVLTARAYQSTSPLSIDYRESIKNIRSFERNNRSMAVRIGERLGETQNRKALESYVGWRGGTKHFL